MVDSRYKPHRAMTLRLKPNVARLLEDTAAKTGLDKTAVLIVALRDYAKREGVAEVEEQEGGNDGE